MLSLIVITLIVIPAILPLALQPCPVRVKTVNRF